MSIRQKTYILLAVRAMFNAFGDIELKRGMTQLGPATFSSAAEALHLFARVISSGTI
jgi:hypothetical protein